MIQQKETRNKAVTFSDTGDRGGNEKPLDAFSVS
jgi:hypothetical protein